jgi:hypothetical protein
VTERPEALSEIVAQHQNFQVYWLQLLNIDASTHPHTFLLMKLMARVGEVMMMHFKRQAQNLRPRPSQVCPTLLPPVPVPGHSSYPAGHSLISWLTSIGLIELTSGLYDGALKELAMRVGRNRAIGGLHYMSDLRPARDAADLILPVLNDCQTYKDVKQKALLEW